MNYAATVVITTYNQGHFVLRAVADVLAQSVPCEIIVVDDGSTDRTLQLLERFGDRVRVIALPHSGGPSAPRNAGMLAATSPALSFLDADDRIHPDKVEKQLAEMERSGYEWCLCDALIEGWQERDGVPAFSRGMAGFLEERLSTEKSNPIPVMVPLVSLALLDAAGGFLDTDLEDWEFWKRVAAIAPAANVPEVLATYSWTQRGRSGRVGIDGKHLREYAGRPVK